MNYAPAMYENEDHLRGLVRGWVWKMRIMEVVFELWTARSISRTEARAQLFDRANYGYPADSHEGPYEPEDVERVWKTKGVR